MNKSIIFLLFVGVFLIADVCQAINIDNSNQQVKLEQKHSYNDEATCDPCLQRCKHLKGEECGQKVCCEPNMCVSGRCRAIIFKC